MPNRSPRRERVAARATPAVGGSSASAGVHRAATRVVDILEVVARTRDGLSLKDLSERLGAPKSSLLPLLRTLTGRAYLDQANGGAYRIGQKVVELGMGSLAHQELPDLARPVLTELMKRTGEAVFLGVLASDGTSVVYIDKVESDQLIRYSAGLGERRPLHATAIGKSVLAFLPEPQRERMLGSLQLTRYTERTVSSVEALRIELEAIRRTGVSVNIEQAVSGASGIAAPIFDRRGRVVAACTIGGPTHRVRARLRRLVTEVKGAARAVSALLGYREPADISHAPAEHRPARRKGRTTP